MRRWLWMVGLLAACSASETGGGDDLAERQDGEDDVFVQQGKADSNGVEERSWEAACVMNAANTLSFEQLDEDVKLWSVAAENLVEGRPYRDLQAVDDVRWIGWYAFHQLSRYAQANDLCPKLNEEYMPADEPESTQAVVEASVDHVQSEYDDGQRPALRDAHPKAHGCVKAFFQVDNRALPESMRVGIFANDGKDHPAWIRFSNGSFTISPDPEGDIRGMAIKLMEVEGAKILDRHKNDQTQDILLINTPVLMVRNAFDYVEFSQKAFDGNPVTFFFSLNPLDWHIRELTITLNTLRKKIASPLLSRYWSTTPYKLGDAHSVKYSARPCQGESDERPDDAGDNYLREVMGAHLAENDACFEFLIQAQTDARTMPIEDPSIEWDDATSPYLVAGKIHIPVQRFDHPAQDEFCEHLSFNPWHALPEHAPMGGINRVRRAVYDAVSALRHDLNEVQRTEPVDHSVPGL